MSNFSNDNSKSTPLEFKQSLVRLLAHLEDLDISEAFRLMGDADFENELFFLKSMVEMNIQAYQNGKYCDYVVAPNLKLAIENYKEIVQKNQAEPRDFTPDVRQFFRGYVMETIIFSLVNILRIEAS